MASPAARTPARRADARQSIDRILRAAVTCLGRDPHASMGDIAAEAGVGRVTVYAHFPSREALVEATLSTLLTEGETVLAGLDLTGDPRTALRTLIETSWLLMAQAGMVLEAAKATLPPRRIHELHADPERRINELIRRGQSEGVFRDDLSAPWLASVLHHVMKGVAGDVVAGRLSHDDAQRLITEAILGAYGER